MNKQIEVYPKENKRKRNWVTTEEKK